MLKGLPYLFGPFKTFYREWNTGNAFKNSPGFIILDFRLQR